MQPYHFVSLEVIKWILNIVRKPQQNNLVGL